jgi:asparagine synthase (glutamine-hydrolysing)
MCGIWAYVNQNGITNATELYSHFMKISHRGPDCSYFQTYKNVSVGFHRLAIMDIHFSSNQPYVLYEKGKTIVFICNGEIYNFQELIKKYELGISGHSDCLVIPKLYLKLDYSEFIQMFKREIKGEYAFVLFEFDDFNVTKIVAGRDHIGVRPLYWSKTDNEIGFCSEVKGITYLNNIKEFEAGTIVSIEKNVTHIYDFKYIYTIETNCDIVVRNLGMVQKTFIDSVRRRMNADRPIALALSGGIDSSYVAGVYRYLLGPDVPIYTYVCGMSRGTDIVNAKKVAEHIKSIHTEIIFSEEEALSVIPDVIYTIESWDITTIRASVGQYLLCKYIGTKTNNKILMVGEGPDEVCSSYLFNYNAPNGEELHECAMDLVREIIYYDVKRADRCIARWGLEGRVAGLDPEFIEAYWEIPSVMRHPKYKNCEKWWFRKSMEDLNLVPNEIVWRKKEAFSDGVSSKERSWFNIIQEYVDKIVSDEEFENNKEEYQVPTKEAYYYKKIFTEYFGKEKWGIIPHYWQPRWVGGEGYVDPSARILKVYE